MDAGASPVSYRLDGAVATIVVDDGKVNALSLRLLNELGTALSRAEDEASAVSIVGRPGVFSAGFDMSVLDSDDPRAMEAMISAGGQLLIRLVGFPIPVVFGITGHAVAMGAILSCGADYRIGAQGPFRIGFNEVAVGMAVPRVACEVIAARMSPRHLTRAVLLAELVSPAEAVEAGLLDEVVEADAVAERATLEAASLSELHTGAFRLTRRNLRGPLVARMRAIADQEGARIERP